MRTVNDNNRTISTSEELSAYKGELLRVQEEVNFFIKTINKLKKETIGDSTKSLKVAELAQDSTHFKTLTTRLIEELNAIHHDQTEHAKLDKETFKDQRYFKLEMGDFRPNYKEFKLLLMSFVASFEYLTVKNMSNVINA